MTTTRQRRTILGLGACLAFATAAPAWAQKDNPDNERWLSIRNSAFAGRTLIDDTTGKVVELDVPVRAEDAAVVPIAIRTKIEQRPDLHVRKLTLVIDNNPSPMGAVFNFTPAAGRAEIETRVRIEEYTNVRAIAETSDGKLYMARKFVKASGGCSAPAGKDLAEAMSRIGKMRFKLGDPTDDGQPTQATLMISHPNVSGLAMDQVSRLYAQPHFVRSVEVTYDGKPIMNAELDFTISENPHFRFFFVPSGNGELKARVIDSNDMKFESSIQYRPRG